MTALCAASSGDTIKKHLLNPIEEVDMRTLRHLAARLVGKRRISVRYDWWYYHQA
ncbi:hypothetical protein [Solwaraspora sp. WMMA2065]|uniref:hypothetical protein n=1 Tax=Solwaraspora sp. WMMA2065 TaxID=3015166 RepID=UPI00259BA706|nr:hypothetical protein [Solwaraspora sp. WMMA2065]WJK36279.1 hypothetical protein O7610_07975 [Solwaraspora sp. WMMA2065]